MRAALYAVIGLVVWSMAGFSPVSATEFRSGGSVAIPAGTTVDDELYAAGGEISIAGNVSGDLLATGGQISVRGRVEDSATLAGGNVSVTGTIGNNLRAAGGEVKVTGTISDNASVAGGNVTLSRGARVRRDLQVGGGNLTIEADIGRNLRAAGGEVFLNGEVGGNARVNAGRLRIGPNAVIQGDLVYASSQEASIDPGARVLGKTIRRPLPERREPSRAGKVTLWILSFLALYAAGAAYTAVVPRFSRNAADRITGRLWITLLIGFILCMVVPAVILVLMFTLIGIPLSLILLVSYLILLYLSRAFVGLAIGRWLFARFGSPDTSPYVHLLIGLLILWALLAIPFVGWLLHAIAVLLGLGALAAEEYDLTRKLRSEGQI